MTLTPMTLHDHDVDDADDADADADDTDADADDADTGVDDADA